MTKKIGEYFDESINRLITVYESRPHIGIKCHVSFIEKPRPIRKIYYAPEGGPPLEAVHFRARVIMEKAMNFEEDNLIVAD